MRARTIVVAIKNPIKPKQQRAASGHARLYRIVNIEMKWIFEHTWLQLQQQLAVLVVYTSVVLLLIFTLYTSVIQYL